MTDTPATPPENEPTIPPVAPAPVAAPAATSTPTEPAAAAEEPAAESQPAATKRPTPATMDDSWQLPKLVDATESVALPSSLSEDLTAAIEAIPNEQVVQSPSDYLWQETVQQSIATGTMDDRLAGSFSTPGADFHNRVTHMGLKLDPRVKNLRKEPNSILKGDAAVFRVLSHLGQGSMFEVPLWHTGIWVSLKPPTEARMLDLNTTLEQEKIRFGRYTYGMLFSNYTSVTMNTLIDFVLEHVYLTSAKTDELPFSELKNFISCLDIPALLWGAACTLYPNGFNYSRACTVHPAECRHVVNEALNLTKLLWVNQGVLSDDQKAFMASRQTNHRSLSEIKNYQQGLSNLSSRRIVFRKDQPSEMGMTLSVPTIAKNLDDGMSWIAGMVQAVDKSLTATENARQREMLLEDRARSAAMRMFGSWVSGIDMDDTTVAEESILNVMETLSSEDDIRNDFRTSISKYIDESTVAVVGIPSYECPACGKINRRDEPLPQHVDIIPLDAATVFFQLITVRLRRLRNR